MKRRNVMRPENQEPEKLALSVEDAAWKLSLSPSFLRLEMARGRLHPIRLGRRVLISQQEIERYLKNRSGDATHSKEDKDGNS